MYKLIQTSLKNPKNGVRRALRTRRTRLRGHFRICLNCFCSFYHVCYLYNTGLNVIISEQNKKRLRRPVDSFFVIPGNVLRHRVLL